MIAHIDESLKNSHRADNFEDVVIKEKNDFLDGIRNMSDISFKLKKRTPMAFQLFGHTINVEYSNNLIREHDSYGLANYRTTRIELQTCDAAGAERNIKEIESTFCHELAHWMLHFMGEEELGENEKFTGLLGNMIHQALSTIK